MHFLSYRQAYKNTDRASVGVSFCSIIISQESNTHKRRKAKESESPAVFFAAQTLFGSRREHQAKAGAAGGGRLINLPGAPIPNVIRQSPRTSGQGRSRRANLRRPPVAEISVEVRSTETERRQLGAREAMPQWGIRRRRKRPERVMRNEQGEALQASPATIEHAFMPPRQSRLRNAPRNK